MEAYLKKEAPKSSSGPSFKRARFDNYGRGFGRGRYSYRGGYRGGAGNAQATPCLRCGRFSHETSRCAATRDVDRRTISVGIGQPSGLYGKSSEPQAATSKPQLFGQK